MEHLSGPVGFSVAFDQWGSVPFLVPRGFLVASVPLTMVCFLMPDEDGPKRLCVSLALFLPGK